MKSFLIRDILSGGQAAAAAAAAAANGDKSGPGDKHLHQVAASASHHHHLQQQLQHQMSVAASSGPFESLAATQARFLAKLAEHQQQVQASKYYEQLQQQHQLQLQQHLQHLQHLHQQHQAQQPHAHNLQHLVGAASSSLAGLGLSLSTHHQHNQRHHQHQQPAATATAAPIKHQKTSSFAYDCASPISSISDVEREEEEEGEDEEDEDNEEEETPEEARHDSSSEPKGGKEKNRKRKDSSTEPDRNNNRDDKDEAGAENNNNNDDDDVDDDEEEIEVEKVTEVAQQQMRLQDDKQFKQQGGNKLPASFQLNSPLDALLQMASSTFDGLKRGEKRKDREGDQQSSTNFTNKQNSKKKRKSRTAFTNTQIYELERRFREQKYLSPTDRDDIALHLHLTNAQVITWFQNRRAKLKRDLEEQKRDIETASILNLHQTLYESILKSQMNPAIQTNDPLFRLPTNVDTTKKDSDMNQLT